LAFEVGWPEAMNLIIKLAGGNDVLLDEVRAIINDPVEGHRRGIEFLAKDHNELAMRQRLQFAPHAAHEWYRLAARIILRQEFYVLSDGSVYRTNSESSLDRLKIVILHVLPGSLSSIDLNRLVLLAFEVRWPEAMNLIIEQAGGYDVLRDEVRVMINDPVEYHRRGIEFLAKVNHLAGLDIDELMVGNDAEMAELVRISDLLIIQNEFMPKYEPVPLIICRDDLNDQEQPREQLTLDLEPIIFDHDYHDNSATISVPIQNVHHVRVLDFLKDLENELMINYARTGFGALTLVIKKPGNEAMVRELLRAGAEPLLRDHEGLTPLHYAGLAVNKSGVIDDLLHAGVPVDIQGWSNDENRDTAEPVQLLQLYRVTPLLQAALQKEPEAIQTLLKAGAAPVIPFKRSIEIGGYDAFDGALLILDELPDEYGVESIVDGIYGLPFLRRDEAKKFLGQLQKFAARMINIDTEEPSRHFVPVLNILKQKNMLDQKIEWYSGIYPAETLFAYANRMNKYKHAQAIREVEEGRIDTFPTEIPSTSQQMMLKVKTACSVPPPNIKRQDTQMKTQLGSGKLKNPNLKIPLPRRRLSRSRPHQLSQQTLVRQTLC
jgi:hypothetical protein